MTPRICSSIRFSLFLLFLSLLKIPSTQPNPPSHSPRSYLHTKSFSYLLFSSFANFFITSRSGNEKLTLCLFKRRQKMKVEMAADFVDNNSSSSNSRRVAAKNGGQVQGQGQEQEQLPCPRCDSINTKFCYYNNYNFSQPRHFCKACRRYWTQGGTLRDIPVGGGTRKNAKRTRTAHVTTTTTPTATPAAASSTAHASVNMCGHQDYPLHATPVLMPFQGSTGQFCGGDLKGTNNGNVGLCGSGGFTSLLSTQGPGFLALSGFGLGLGSNFVGDVGLSGLGRGVWGFAGMGDGGVAGGGVGSNSTGSGGGGATGIGNTWQFESGEATTTGFVGGDCFSWPDLAISTPGNGLK